MSDVVAAKRVCLVGATGLTGRSMIERAISRSDVRIVGVARREMKLPYGARMEMLLADPSGWPDAIAATNAKVMVCALGTTMKKAGGDEAAFRAVDKNLVLKCAEAALQAGITHFILVSSVGADAGSKNFYLRVKGEVEVALAKMGFTRLDIVRPGLLRGPRGEDRRPAERLGIIFGPLTNLFLHGKYRKFRSIRATSLADAIFALCLEEWAGRFVHEYDSLRRLIRRSGD